MHLRLDVEVQKSEAEKLRKRKNEVEEDLKSLKTDYKKLRLLMRTAGLGKTSEQWRQEIREEKTKADHWEKKFQEVQARNEAFEKTLSESKSEQVELRARVAELERSLCLYRNCNSVVELRASLNKIEEMKGKIEELEAALQNCEMRIEFLEASEEQWRGQLYHSQNQVRSRDYIMREIVTQIREVADYLQTLVVQAEILSVKYELESDPGQELALLLRKIKALSIRAKSYCNSLQMQEQLVKIQQEMKDQMMDSQRNMMSQLSQLLVGRMDKGKNPMDNVGETNEDP
ncbi:restin homolog [Gossypium hirsutum]|uniref:Restin homolog n=1 Tax=Gossypium hirsutum TaxID=3635 RepID=A0A1U8IJF7_GOSHI|nr:restin homolog [Gossypium hirsutum]